MQGTFIERLDDLHVRLRDDMLRSDADLRLPTVAKLSAAGADFPERVAANTQATVERDGVALVSLDGDVGADQLLSFANYFGCPAVERDPSIQQFVERGVILNLLTAYQPTGDTALQPFAANELLLHSESSGRPITEQPRYIVLLCVNPGADSSQARTVLVGMSDVADRLTNKEREILSHTRYSRSSDDLPILRVSSGRPVFSFRDFGSQALDWTYFGGQADESEVQEAIRTLLAAIYYGGASAICWATGTLAIIDNMRFFHGRTRGAAEPSFPRRHLMRLRLV